jgi:hypothetical protein
MTRAPDPDLPGITYTVSCIHPDTRQFHGESCATLEEAQRRTKELRSAGYQSLTISICHAAHQWPAN